MYHISDIKKFLRCKHLYFYGIDNSSVFKPYLRSDENIVELIKEYFGIDECFVGIRNDPGSRFFNEIDNYEWFIYPRFTDEKIRINIPLMHKEEEGFDLYFVYYGTIIKELDLLNYRISLKLLKKQDIRVRSLSLVYLNPEYVNDGKLDVSRLFLITDRFKGKSILKQVQQTEINYEELIEQMETFDPDKQKAEKGKYCRQNGLCEYYDRCFPEEKQIEDDSILTLVSSRNKNKMYEEGIRILKDADPQQIEGNKVQFAQIMASRNGGIFMDKLVLKQWLEKLSERPISFIDFEWDRYLIPPYQAMKPMDVLCFEFALYYLEKNGKLEHRTFVGTGDCRKEFIEGLIRYLPEKGPILAYNAIGAEQLRLHELGEMFPEYQEKLNEISDRFIDLALPFTEGMIYDTRMQGNYSLKKLVDICSAYSYKDLDIYDGMEAVFSWRNIDLKNAEDDQKIISDLKEYCSLDAYGLFLVYKWLVRLAVESQ